MQRIGKQIRITVTDLQEERIERIAKRHNLPKAQVYRNMIDAGLDLYDEFESVGVVQMLDFVERVKGLASDIKRIKQPSLF